MAEKAVSPAGEKIILEKYFYRDLADVFIIEKKKKKSSVFILKTFQHHMAKIPQFQEVRLPEWSLRKSKRKW